MTKEFLGEHGKVTGLKTVEVTFKDGKLQEVEGTEKIIPAELVLIAAGFIHPQKEGLLEQLGIETDQRGNVLAEDYHSNIDKVFAAGDMRRGQSLVVWAIAEGRKASKAVSDYLTSRD
jgi:glutamate synthase (NADPH/NADH) small chain